MFTPDTSLLEEPNSTCPFCCKGDFKRLGNHLPKCPERNGRDYSHLLSKKTIQKKTRVRSAEANFCPRCHKRFSRLDTHLRTSASCRHIPTKNNSCSNSNGSNSCFPPCQEHSTLSISGNSSESSQLPLASVTITSSDKDSSCFPPAQEFSIVTASESLLSPQPRPDPPQPSPAPAINSPVPSVKPRLYLPRLDDEWKKANTFFETELVPCVLN